MSRSLDPYPSRLVEGRSSAEEGLDRRLSGLDATFLVVGIVIGSGIFLTTGIIALDLPSPGWILVAWILGGLLTVAGALTFGELGAALPEAGGQYVYLREAFGMLPAFLFGWMIFLVYQTGAIAAVAAACTTYLAHFFPSLEQPLPGTGPGHLIGVEVPLQRLAAAAVIILFTLINVRGVRLGSEVQNVTTAIKVLALLAFGSGLLWLGIQTGTGALGTPFPPVPTGDVLRGVAVAQVAVLWTFDGWHNVTFSAGEVRNPGRNLPLSLISGTLLVTCLYVLVNGGYLAVLSMPEIQGELLIAERASEEAFGAWGGHLVSFLIVLSTAAAVNGVVFTGARVYYAMALDGVFFRVVGRVHPRYGTPAVALWLQGAWASVLVLTGSYDQLFTFVTFSALLMYTAAAAAVFRLRNTHPHLKRPYRVPGYPVIPLAFLASTLLLAGNTLVARPTESVSGLIVLAAGLPAYYAFSRSASR